MALACATAWARAAESRVKVCWSAGASLRARALRDCADATIRGRVGERLFPILGECRVVARRLRGAAVVDEGGVVVVLAGKQARQRDERFRVRGLELGGEAKQRGRGVFFAGLPRRQAGVEGGRP